MAVGLYIRRVWRYQKGNQNPYIKEEQTTQWPKEKVQKDKQRSTKHTHKTKDRVTRTPLRCSGRQAVPKIHRGKYSNIYLWDLTAMTALDIGPFNLSSQNKFCLHPVLEKE